MFFMCSPVKRHLDFLVIVNRDAMNVDVPMILNVLTSLPLGTYAVVDGL